MQASEEVIERLRALRDVDMKALNANRAWEKLPEKEQLRDVLTKVQSVQEKAKSVQALVDESDRVMFGFEQEEETLLTRQMEMQDKINASKDFRAIDSLTRDLNGIAKRLDKLEEDVAAAKVKREQLLSVVAQVDQATAVLAKQEAELKAKVVAARDATQAVMNECARLRQQIASGIPANIVAVYEAARKRCGGIPLAELQGHSCSVCRTVIDQNKMLQLKKDAPIAECPQCHRMLIIET